MTKRDHILDTAKSLINGDREAHYGTPQENFTRIAKGWSVILECDVTPELVALCMAWLKIARLVNGPHDDSYIDGAAYLALAGELADAEKKEAPYFALDGELADAEKKEAPH